MYYFFYFTFDNIIQDDYTPAYYFLFIVMLKQINVCQGMMCQNKGAKSILHRLQTQYREHHQTEYANLHIDACECVGDCEQGPIVRVNDSIILRQMDNVKSKQLLEKPSEIVGEIVHVLEEDREVFDRIIKGDLF